MVRKEKSGTAVLFKASLLLLTVLLFSATAKKGMGMHHAKMRYNSKDVINAGYFSGGLQFIDIEQLNDYLDENLIDEFPSYGAVLNFGKFMSYKRLVTTGELNLIFWESSHSQNFSTGMWGGSIITNIGFNVFDYTMPVRLYPLLGMGYGLMQLRRDEIVRSFDDAFLTQGVEVRLYQHTFLLNFGGGMDYTFNIKDIKKLELGIRGGFLLDPVSHDSWISQSGSEITNAPEISMTGGYLRIVFGLRRFYWKKGMKHK